MNSILPHNISYISGLTGDRSQSIKETHFHVSKHSSITSSSSLIISPRICIYAVQHPDFDCQLNLIHIHVCQPRSWARVCLPIVMIFYKAETCLSHCQTQGTTSPSICWSARLEAPSFDLKNRSMCTELMLDWRGWSICLLSMETFSWSRWSSISR